MNNLIKKISGLSYHQANDIIRQICGIVFFFISDEEKDDFVYFCDSGIHHVAEDRVSYGDWQTPATLAEKVCHRHLAKYGSPDVVIEPTCGVGAFVIAALETFPTLTEIHAIEINSDYLKELKYTLLFNAFKKNRTNYPDIYLYNNDVFDFDFSKIIDNTRNNGKTLALLGNPPWVTNSTQGKRESRNIPVKNNRYKLKGIDAITGKSNFDISEYITLHLLNLMKGVEGAISFLLKNSVIRNIVKLQNIDSSMIDRIEQTNIDASSEFQVSVSAACFSAEFSKAPSKTCTINDFYTEDHLGEYGWIGDAFVSDLNKYRRCAYLDGQSEYEWRSGIKHDCASVLELKKVDGRCINGLGEDVDVEESMIYPLLKSSDVSHYPHGQHNKYIIIPQHRIGENIDLLSSNYPKTFAYLNNHESFFLKRKSSIYKNKGKFCIFGIGDYSFRSYKIVVSSLYKDIKFRLIEPLEGKPVMLDDTCYQLDFDSKEEAESIYEALISDEATDFLNSLVFKDAKRVVTKSLLMRLDLHKLCTKKKIPLHSKRYKENIQQLFLFD